MLLLWLLACRGNAPCASRASTLAPALSTYLQQAVITAPLFHRTAHHLRTPALPILTVVVPSLLWHPCISLTAGLPPSL